MRISSSVSLSTTTETELLDYLARHATANTQPYAIWRLPNATVRQMVVSNRVTRLRQEEVIEDLPSGFIFSPFDKSRESVFLQADLLFSFQNGVIMQDADTLSTKSIEWLRQQLASDPVKSGAKYAAGTVHPAKKTDYIALVKKCLENISAGVFEKVVPSRQHSVSLPEGFDSLEAFEKICDRYAHALIALVSVPGIGTWLTATPEVLVTVENKTIFRTVALAGTKRFDPGTEPREVAWTQKEIEEQALVERYVISCFKKIRLREYDEHGPKTVVAGNLMHLKTDFEVDMVATGFPQLGSIMLQLLHPTSAVCGMPLKESMEFLKANEGYDRSYYSGYLGPVNVNNNIHIFVNLRCMQLLEKQCILYAGAGVTIDSVPELEFEETEMKFNTLRNVIL